MNTYTDSQVAAALAALEVNGGNVSQTSRELGISRPTLIEWRDRSGLTLPTPEKTPHDFASLWAEKQQKVLELIDAKSDTASFRDLSIFAGIAADKHQDYRDGRKGAQVNIDNRTQVQADSVILQIVQARQSTQVDPPAVQG